MVFRSKLTLIRESLVEKTFQQFFFFLKLKLDMMLLSFCITLPETNIAPENGWLEYQFPIGMAYFHGLRLLVSGRVVVLFLTLKSQKKFNEADEATSMDTMELGPQARMALLFGYMGVEPKNMGNPPKSSHFNRVWNHYFHHPFWGF